MLPIIAQPLYTQSFNGTHNSIWPRLGRKVLYIEKQAYRQSKPYNLPMPYSHIRYFCPKPGYTGEQDAWNLTGTWTVWCKSSQQSTTELEFWARSRARSDFYEKLGDSSSWLVSFLERKQAMAMITTRVTQLGKFSKAMSSFRFGEAAKTIIHPDDTHRWKLYRNLRKEGKLRTGARFAASNYLEFHFGLSPLLSDIGNSIKLLTGPVPFGRVKGRGVTKSDATQQSPLTENYARCRVQSKVSVRYYADVSVTNPNLWLANRLGLVNPLAAAADKVPWSFVFDWFVNLSEVLGQFGATAGLSVINQHYSVKTEIGASWTLYTYSYPAAKYYVNDVGYNEYSAFRRFIGDLPTVTLKVRKPWIISPRRGAAMASLLVQQIPSRESAGGYSRSRGKPFKVLPPDAFLNLN